MNPTHQDMEKGANTVNEVQILEKEYDLKKKCFTVIADTI